MAQVRHLGLFPWCIPVGADGLRQRLQERSGFDFSGLNVQVGPGYLWPISLTRNELIELWWRIKSLKVTHLDSSTHSLQIVPGATTERDLVCFKEYPVEALLEHNNELTVSITWDLVFYDPTTGRFPLSLLVIFAQYDEDYNLTAGSTSYYLNSEGDPDTELGTIDFLGHTLSMGGVDPLVYQAGMIEIEDRWTYAP